MACINKSLSTNTFVEKIIQSLHDDLLTFEKLPGMHVRRMLEMSRCLYTGVKFKQNVG